MSEESVGAAPAKKTTKKTTPAGREVPPTEWRRRSLPQTTPAGREVPGLDPDFDIDAWIDGTTGITATARIIKRGDLVAERQRLRDELRVAKQIRPLERSVGDPTPESVQEELDRVEAEIWSSSIVVTMQDRTEARRAEIRDAVAAAEGLSATEDPQRYRDVTTLAVIADSIIKLETADGREIPIPAGGFGWERLERIREQAGEASLLELAERYSTMTQTSPAVQAPFSLSSSSGRGGATSRRNSGRPARGGSARSSS